MEHNTYAETSPGVWRVAKPIRYSSWWWRRKAEKACAKTKGHCWHPKNDIDWFCCMCGGEK